MLFSYAPPFDSSALLICFSFFSVLFRPCSTLSLFLVFFLLLFAILAIYNLFPLTQFFLFHPPPPRFESLKFPFALPTPLIQFPVVRLLHRVPKKIQPNLCRMLRWSFAKNEYTENHEQSTFRMAEMRLMGLATFEFSLFIDVGVVIVVAAAAVVMSYCNCFCHGPYKKLSFEGKNLPNRKSCITTTAYNGAACVLCTYCT